MTSLPSKTLDAAHRGRLSPQQQQRLRGGDLHVALPASPPAKAAHVSALPLGAGA